MIVAVSLMIKLVMRICAVDKRRVKKMFEGFFKNKKSIYIKANLQKIAEGFLFHFSRIRKSSRYKLILKRIAMNFSWNVQR